MGRRNEQRARWRVKKYAEQDGLCWLCGFRMYPFEGEQGYWVASLDHVLPARSGGRYSDTNLRLAHEACNRYRGHRYTWMYEQKHFQENAKRLGIPAELCENAREVKGGAL